MMADQNGSSQSEQQASGWVTRYQDYFYVLLIAVGFVLLSNLLGSPRVSGPDESYYAVVARNLAENGSLNTTLYLPDDIVQTGYPHRDTHLPGYMILLALPVALLGPSDVAMLLPSQIAFLISALLVFWVGKKLFSTLTGYASVVAFCLYPLTFFYANTAMAESTLVMLALLFLVLWLSSLSQAQDRPRLLYALALSLVLAAGLLVRNTFIIFLPPALYALWRWPDKRWRAAALFGVSLALLLVFLVYPLYQGRAQGTYTFYQIMSTGQPDLIVKGFLGNFGLQASRHLGPLKDFPDDYIRLLQVVFLPVGIIAFFRFKSLGKATAVYFLYTALGVWLALSIFYTSSGSRGLRGLLMVIPPGIILLNGLIFSLRRRWLLWALFGLQLFLFAFFAWIGMRPAVTKRLDFHRDEMAEAAIITENIGAYQPRVVMGYKPWLYAVHHFPVEVIWRLPESLETMQAIQEQVRVDAIILDNAQERDRILDASREDLIAGDFRLVNEEAFEGYYFLVRGDMFRQPVNAGLGPDMTLLGVDRAQKAVPGGPLDLTLVWQAENDIQKDYSLVLRLLDEAGSEAQYWLGRPILSSYPTTEWQAGETVADAWDIQIDPDLEPGDYQLEVEVYDSAASQPVGKTGLGLVRVEADGQ